MVRLLLILPFLLIAGCASYRMVDRAEWIGQARQDMVEREVLTNFSRTIFDEYSIPTRTQLSSEIKLNFTDSAGITAALPLTGTGQNIGLGIGANSDQYQGGVSVETKQKNLRDLRELYRHAVWTDRPNRPHLEFFTIIHRGGFSG